MKNLISFLLILALAMGLAACGSKNTGDSMSNGTENNGGGAFSSAENTVYGKITAITGNEIEIALAKRTGAEDAEDDLKDAAPIVPGENDLPVIGGEGEDSSAGIEFTGETLSLTVPAGIQIYSMGQEINLSSLKKGDMVTIAFDSDTHDNIISVEKVE